MGGDDILLLISSRLESVPLPQVLSEAASPSSHGSTHSTNQQPQLENAWTNKQALALGTIHFYGK